MIYRKLLTCLFFLIILSKGYSQRMFYTYEGLVLEQHFMGDIGLCYGPETLNYDECGVHHKDFLQILPSFGSEFTFDNSIFVIGPKLSLEINYSLPVALRLNFIDYTDFRGYDYRLTPEIGLSLAGFYSLFFGYNIPISKTELDWVTRYKIAFRYAIPFWRSKRERNEDDSTSEFN